MRKNLAIRADANTNIGSGHLMRCLALAQAWQDHGGNVTFLSHCDSEALRQRIIDEGFDFISIEKSHPDPYDLETTLQVLERIAHSAERTAQNPEKKAYSENRHVPCAMRHAPTSHWLVLDGYHFTADYQQAIRKNGYRLLVIDDQGHADKYFADIILNQNLHADEDMYSTGKSCTRFLLGRRYILLRQEFLKQKERQREIPHVARKIIITMGGGDPDNVTLKVINALNLLDYPDLEVKIVVGPSNPNKEILINAMRHAPCPMLCVENATNMPGLMVWADLAVSAGGSTCWELAFMELPSINIVLADNQNLIAESLDKAGIAVNLGWHNDLSIKELAHELKRLINSSEKRFQMSNRGSLLIDGRGAYRVCEILLQPKIQEGNVSENIIHG